MALVQNSIKAIKGGSISGTDQSTGATLPTTEATVTWGNSVSLFGLTWTPSDINSSGFGVAMSFKSSVSPANISQYLKATNFGFSIPADESIVGIKFDAKIATTGQGTASSTMSVNCVKATIYTSSAIYSSAAVLLM